jgi:mannosyltransferase
MAAPLTTTERLLPRIAGYRRPRFLQDDRALLGALAVLAVVLRAPNLGRAYWIDEGISVGIASHPLSQLPRLLRHDGSPPLFYVLLHFWMKVFGRSEVATHLLPLLISLLAIPVGYWAGRELFDRRAGLAAAALLATNPFLNWYSTETRMYTLLVVVALVAPTLAWRAYRDRCRTDAVGAVIAFAALMYTHDWSLYLTAATGLALLWLAWRDRDRVRLAWVVGSGAAVLILWLPWLSSFTYQASNTAAPWAVRPGIGDFFADPSSVLGGTLGFLIVPTLAIGAGLCWNQARPERRRAAALLATVALAATALGFLGALVEPSWTARYLAIIVAPYLLAAAGLLATSLQGRVVLAGVCSALVLWSLVGSLLPNPSSRYAKDNMAAVAAAAAPHLAPGDLVVVDQTEQLAVARYYLSGDLVYATPTGPVADPTVVDWRNLVSRLEQATPCQALGPTVDALAVGSSLLEIIPARRLGASGSAWSRAVTDQAEEVDQFLTDDPALRAVAIYAEGLRPKPYAPVEGILFQKTSSSPSCA